MHEGKRETLSFKSHPLSRKFNPRPYPNQSGETLGLEHGPNYKLIRLDVLE